MSLGGIDFEPDANGMSLFSNYLSGVPGASAPSPKFNLADLFQNKLFQQMLSGAGAAIGGEGSFASKIDKMNQQNISTQNYMKMLRQFLGGLPQGSKVKGDSTKLTVDMPVSALGGEEGGSALAGPLATGGVAAAGAGAAGTPSAMSGFLNPSASSLDINNADLAGLTPQDISQALQLKQTQEQISEKSVSDLMDMIYKQELINASRAARKEVFTTPEGAELTSKQYIDWVKVHKEDPTTAMKNYNYAVSQGYEGNFMDFQDAATTTHKKDYNTAVAGGYKGTFNEWMNQMAKAGASVFDFGETKLKAKAGAEGRQEADVTGASFASEVLKDLQKDDRKWRMTADSEKYMNKFNEENPKAKITILQARERLQRLSHLKEMDARIKAQFVGHKVIHAADGWYVDGKLTVKDPYAQ